MNETGSGPLAINETGLSGSISPDNPASLLNQTDLSPDVPCQAAGNNYTWVDPPLNTSETNPYYLNNNSWVIDHQELWTMDLNPPNNTNKPLNIQFDETTNRFWNFGSSPFAILINASNVIFDGMGATLDGGGYTEYGIVVNNQNATYYNIFDNDPEKALGGISITNITLTGFTEAGIFFNNVIGNLPGTITPSQITTVNASGNAASGIVLQNSQNIEVSNSHADNNGVTGIWLQDSNSISLINNTANQNGGVAGSNGYGFYLNGSANNNLINNTASGNYGINGSDGLIGGTGGNGYGIYFINSNYNNLTGNNVTGNYGGSGGNGYGFLGYPAGGDAGDGYGIFLTGSSDNTLMNNNVSGNHGGKGGNGGNYYGGGDGGDGGDGYGIYLYRSNRNNLTINIGTDNEGGTGGSGGPCGLSGGPGLGGNGGNSYGFYLNDSSTNNLTGNTATGNRGGAGGDGFGYSPSGSGVSGGGYGIYIGGSNYTTLIGNTANWNYGGYGGAYVGFGSGGNGGSGYGIYLTSSSYNNLTRNNATGNYGGRGGNGHGDPTNPADGGSGGNGYGIYLNGSNLNNLTRNIADGNYGGAGGSGETGTAIGGWGYGMYLIESTRNSLSENTAGGNYEGMNLVSSHTNVITGNLLSGNNLSGIDLSSSHQNNLTGNNASCSTGEGEYNNGIILQHSNENTLTGNTVNGNYDGIWMEYSNRNNITANTINDNGNTSNTLEYDSTSNTFTGNTISGNTKGIWINGSSNDNLIYNNYFNNTQNAYVSTDSTGNIWNTTPTPGPNIVGGSYLGGNYWAQPDGNGWSQTHLDIGMGFTEPYNVTGSTSSSLYQALTPGNQNIDQHPLVLLTPTPTPTQSPGPSSGSYSVVIQPVTPGTLPYDASFTGNTIPGTMEACHSYTVGVTVKNTGTMNWSPANGVVLIPSSSNGFTFDPSRCTIPAGVVVQPGQSYTFPVKITVPCPMKDGTYQLRFRMAYTVQTKSGPVEITFGESLADSVTVGTSTVSGVKSGVKTITPYSTIPGSTGRFTTSIPNIADIRPATTIAPGYYTGTSRNVLNGTMARNFLPVTGLLWTVFVPDE